MAWLYQEYSAYQVDAMEDDSESSQSYSDCLLNLMDGLYSKLDPKDKWEFFIQSGCIKPMAFRTTTKETA